MIVNQKFLLQYCPIEDMLTCKKQATVASYGLTEVGYDIRVKQDIKFKYDREQGKYFHSVNSGPWEEGNLVLISSMERFTMPISLVGLAYSKSSWSRRGLYIPTAVVEPGWEGHLTLAISSLTQEDLHIPSGSGIAQIIFEEIKEPKHYEGKYQNQGQEPTPAREANCETPGFIGDSDSV